MYSKNKCVNMNKVSRESKLSQGSFAAGIFLFSFLLCNAASAQGSFEMSCRTKAKELAAETYKGCMTDARQTQIEQIRKDYKEKLSELKSHYDKELKKLSTNQEAGIGAGNGAEQLSLKAKAETKKNEIKNDLKKTKQRLSGARIPQKKMPSQIIDFSSSKAESQGESQAGTTNESSEARAQADLNTQNQFSEDARYQGDIEIVEVAPQE